MYKDVSISPLKYTDAVKMGSHVSKMEVREFYFQMNKVKTFLLQDVSKTLKVSPLQIEIKTLL